MTITTSATTLLLRGIADELEGAGLGDHAAPGTPVAVGSASSPTIVVGTIPQGSGVTIGLLDYPVEDEPGIADATLGVNVRIRGDVAPDTARDIAEAIFLTLHGRHNVAFGGVWIDQMWRQSYADLGRDELGNFERSENYYVQLNRPGVTE